MADSFKVLKIVFLSFLLFDLLVGLACLGVGIWFHASADIHAYITVFVRSSSDGMMQACAGILLAMGLILALLTAVAGIGVFLNDPRFLRMFVFLIWIVLVLGLICGFIAVGFYYDIHRYVKNGMREQLNNHYSWDSRIGMAWNRVQVKKRCCGIDGSWDYQQTDWYGASNPDPVNVQSFVPDSCCVLNFDQDRELSWVDPQNIRLKDKLRCNQDAEGNKDNSPNLNRMGCFSALFAKNKDNWHDQDILTIIYLMQGLGLGAGFLQVIAILFAIKYLATMKTRNARDGKNLVGRY